jgi:transketolase
LLNWKDGMSKDPKYSNPRAAYGETLLALAAENPAIVALDADLCKSTMSVLVQNCFPERFFEMGIAEANMLATAAGLALSGKIPFVHSFAVFVTGRAYDQIRQSISIAALNVKITGSSAGLSDFGDGSTHQSVEDLSLMMGLPNMTVISPCDATEIRKALPAIVKHCGPVYLRISRNDMLDLLDENATFEIGPVRRLRDGSDVVVFATGVMVAKALEAAENLQSEGVSARVVSVSTLKPLDVEGVRRECQGMRAALTAEEHSVMGGLGSAVAGALRRQPIPLEYVGIQDRFGISGASQEELLRHYGLTAEAIAGTARDLLGMGGL